MTEQTPTPSTAHTGEVMRAWAERCGGWVDARFPDDDLRQRGLILGEEGGEVMEAALLLVAIGKAQRAILKAEQGIRGGTAHWLGELPKEAADVFFCLASLAHRAGFDLGDAIEAKWAAMEHKVYEVRR